MTRGFNSSNDNQLKGVEASRTSKAGRSWTPSPILLLMLIIVAMVLVNSVDFRTLSFQFPNQDGYVVLALLGFGVLSVLLYSAVALAPLFVAQAGHTELAERLAETSTKFIGLFGRQSNDYTDSLLTAAQVCRQNGSYDKSIQYCKSALETIEVRKRDFAALPEPLTAKQRELRQLVVSMERSYAYLPVQAHLILGWNYYDLGNFAAARKHGLNALMEVGNAQSEEMGRASQPRELDKELLTRNLLIADAEARGFDVIQKRLNYLAANVYELLGVIASVEAEKDEIDNLFSLAASLHQKDEMPAWRSNFGFALLNIGDPDKALVLLEQAAKELKNDSDTTAATVFTNLGEGYRQKGDFDKAKSFLQSSLRIKLKRYPLNHPEIAETNHYLGRLYENIGDRTKAREYFKQSIDASVSSVGVNHPLVVLKKMELQKI